MSKNQFYKVLVLAQKNFDPSLVVIPPNFCHVQVLFFEMSSCKGGSYSKFFCNIGI